ncbi:uncharacterized protein LOC111948292 [Oryzias latipes]|uniref:uncharacterized protein LOC111948292 n=1 Tax=Oryzias latipes TaxID=8090 RepID=UPI000CE17D0E|nr:uncharacterized protein LOC111948292 [Oryzias latipes]
MWMSLGLCSMPPIPACHGVHRKRAWYDSLLGGAGTILGLSDTANTEVTRSMLSSAGQDASQALHSVGAWMPTTVLTQQQAAKVFFAQFGWTVTAVNEAATVLKNVTKALDMTICNVQGLHARLQQDRFKRIVTTNNPHEWRNLWNISDGLWLHIHPEKTICNATACTVRWVQMNVTEHTPVCKYHVLPVVTLTGYWYVILKGDWFSPQTNLTYDLSTCDQTDQGMACLVTSRYREPCLTEDTALCEWYVEKPSDLLWQIAPHTICIATINPHPMLLWTPFSGCLKNVNIWKWKNVTYQLTNFTSESHLTMLQWNVLHMPWKVSLERFICALNRSTDVQKIINSYRSNVSRLMISTVITKNKVVHAARMVEQHSAHHWWDIFSGMSVTARTTVVPPLIILIVIIAVLTLCNILTCVYIRHVRREVSKLIYNLAFK